MSATPRPWRVGYGDGSGMETVTTVATRAQDDLPLRSVAAVSWGCDCCKGEADDEDMANADLIVRAVNAFAALLAVARAADDALLAAMARDERLDPAFVDALTRLDREHPGWREWTA